MFEEFRDKCQNRNGDTLKRKKILELQKCSDRYTIITNRINEYKHKCGVWVMYNAAFEYIGR